MYTYKDLTSKKIFSLVSMIKRKYGYEESIKFKLSLCTQTLNEMIVDYYNEKSLKDIAQYNNISRPILKEIFIFYKVKLRTPQEDAIILNKKLPKIIYQKYGVINVGQLEIQKEKTRKTKLKRYNNPYFNNPEKVKKTNKEKYGVENPFQSEEIKTKIRETCKNRYGVPNYTKTDEFKEKFKQTCLKKYGVDHNSKTKEFKEKYKQTCLEKYGVDNYFKYQSFIDNNYNEELINKRKESNYKNGNWIKFTEDDLEKYRNYNHIVRLLTRKIYRKYKNLINPNNLPISKTEYQIDHIRSIIDCFIDGFSPEECANYKNLQIISAHDNYVKNRHSQLTKDELIAILNKKD